MALPSENKRTSDVRVRLAPDMMEKLEHHSKLFGMPPSTMAAFAIADWVQRQDNNRKLTQMAVLDATRNGLPDMEKIMPVILQMLPQIDQALTQPNLPLEGEATPEGGA